MPTPPRQRRRPLATLWGIVRISRPWNAVLAAFAAIIGALAAGATLPITPTDPELLRPVVLVALAGLLGTAGGNALNDLRDLHIDRTAHPERPLPQGQLSVRTARQMVLVAWALAVALAMLAHTHAGMLAAANVAILSAYELRLKREGLPGNLAIGIVSGSLFPLGALAVGGSLALPILLGLIAAAAHVGRELFKDAEDERHDRSLRRTFAVRYGTRLAVAVGAVAIAIAVALSPLPYLWHGWGRPYLWSVAIADLVFLGAIAAALRDPGRGRAVAKAAMAVALLAFLLGALG